MTGFEPATNDACAMRSTNYAKIVFALGDTFYLTIVPRYLSRPVCIVQIHADRSVFRIATQLAPDHHAVIVDRFGVCRPVYIRFKRPMALILDSLRVTG